jgi:hypothetical protein
MSEHDRIYPQVAEARAGDGYVKGGYIRTQSPDGAIRYTAPAMGTIPNYGPATQPQPDCMPVAGWIEMMRHDGQQVLKEIDELRERLGPVLREGVSIDSREPGEPAPVSSRLADQLRDIHMMIAQMRQSLYYISTRVDL